MLAEIYIEALLIDEELADQVWEAWDSGEIDDFTAGWAWIATKLLGIPWDREVATVRIILLAHVIVE